MRNNASVLARSPVVKKSDLDDPHPAHARQKWRGYTIGQIRPDVAVLEYNRHPEKPDACVVKSWP
jgi:hypothetical protein